MFLFTVQAQEFPGSAADYFATPKTPTLASVSAFFGGAFKRYYDAASSVEKERIKRVLRNVFAIFFETEEAVEFFKALNPNTYWFPNNRAAVDSRIRRTADYARRFVFVGNVCPEKGVREVIELGERLGSTYHIDVFGPMTNGI